MDIFGIVSWIFLGCVMSNEVMVEGAIGKRVGGGMKVPTVVSKSGKMRRGKDGVMVDKMVEMIAGGPTGECWTTSPAPTLGECGMPLQCSGEGQECMVRLKQDERGGVWLLNVSASGLEPRSWYDYNRISCNTFVSTIHTAMINTTVLEVINLFFDHNLCHILNKQSLSGTTHHNPCQYDDCAVVKVWKIFQEGIAKVRSAIERVWNENDQWIGTSYYSHYPALCAIYKRIGLPIEYLNNLLGTDTNEISREELIERWNQNNINSSRFNDADTVYFYLDQKFLVINCTKP